MNINEGKTYRLTVNLNTNDDDSYTVVNFDELLRKEKLKQAKAEGLTTNDVIEEGDSPNKFINIEEKYVQSKRKLSTFTALGAGYDESDSFIDNSEAVEEGLPEGVDTKYGGFYINSGQLEFKELKPTEAIKKAKQKLESTSRSFPSKKKKVEEPNKELIAEDSAKKPHPSEDGLLRNNNNNVIAPGKPVGPGQGQGLSNQSSSKVKLSSTINNATDAIPTKSQAEANPSYLKSDNQFGRTNSKSHEHMVPPSFIDKSADSVVSGISTYLKPCSSVIKSSSHNLKAISEVEAAGNSTKPKKYISEEGNNIAVTAVTSSLRFDHPIFPKKPRKKEEGKQTKNCTDNTTYMQINEVVRPTSIVTTPKSHGQIVADIPIVEKYSKSKDNILNKANKLSAAASTVNFQFEHPIFPKKATKKAHEKQSKSQAEQAANYLQSNEAKMAQTSTSPGLDEGSLRLIKELEVVVKNNKSERIKMFNQPVVNLLNKLERKCRTTMKECQRQKVYDYLSLIMDIPKVSLLKTLEKIIAKYQPALKEEPKFNTLMPMDVLQVKEIKKAKPNSKLSDLNNPLLKREVPISSKSDGKDSRPKINFPASTFLNKVNPTPESNDNLSPEWSSHSLPNSIINQLLKRDISIKRVPSQNSLDKTAFETHLKLKPSKDDAEKIRREEEETKAATNLLSQLVTDDQMFKPDEFVEQKEDEVLCLSSEELQSLRTKQQYDEVIKDLVTLNKLKRNTDEDEIIL